MKGILVKSELNIYCANCKHLVSMNEWYHCPYENDCEILVPKSDMNLGYFEVSDYE